MTSPPVEPLFADADTGLSLVPGDRLGVAVRVEGTPGEIRARAWKQPEPEPVTWMVQAASALGSQEQGTLGLRALVSNATSTTIAFDDLQALDVAPQ